MSCRIEGNVGTRSTTNNPEIDNIPIRSDDINCTAKLAVIKLCYGTNYIVEMEIMKNVAVKSM